MPYRWQESFGWQPTQVHTRRARTVAALVLVAAGWSVGFLAGRMSAWLIPVDTASVVEKRGPSQDVASASPAGPAAPPANATSRTASTPDPAAPSDAGDGKGRTKSEAVSAGGRDDKRAAQGVVAAAPERAQTPKGAESASAEPKADEPEVTLLNPDWKGAKEDAAQSGRASTRESADQTGIAECERRYASFRRSDGTYQPYGRSSRETCPFLR